MSESIYQKATEAAAFVRSRYPDQVSLAVILGSGLGSLAEDLEAAVKISYKDIPSFPVSTAVGHAGRLVMGRCGGVSVAAMQGRFHYYEGYPAEDVTFPVRVFKLLGARHLILTNAAGGVNLKFRAGSLMLISDHLNLMGVNPLRGWNEERFGPRFPDMTNVYSGRCRDIARREAAAMDLTLEEGVYAAVSGPSYETPAEIRMLRTLGADAIGMSTVPEVIVARHVGMEVLGISLISNLAAGILDQPLHHEEVLDMGEKVGVSLATLLKRIIPAVVEEAI